MKPRVVLSMEQALSMTYATLRMVHLGWRVIRLEATPAGDAAHPGDPNRYIGNRVAEADRHAYYVAPNVGKEAIALNLKSAAGRAALHRIIRELDVDIFCCNTIPSRYAALGIDYATLATLKPDLVWAGISAMGPRYPEVPGYDPMIQAMAGYMELTGFADGPPTLSGIPLVDLKAGDEVYANVLLALLERQETGRGRRIDVSMLQAAASWLITTLPLLDMGCGPEEVTRWGNAHRKFIPSNVYPTADGHLYMAVGSNAQWRRLTASAMFHEVGHGGARDTAAVRYRERAAIYREISTLTARHPAAAVAAVLDAAQIPNARINTVAQVLELEAIRARVTTTTLPDGTPVRMQPQAVDIEGLATDYPLAPRYGAQTCAILAEAGYAADEVARLVADGDAATTTPGAR